MKKFLSLVLALVMTMSLVTISASADFTDDSTITYEEAVDVMTAIGVVGGYADGSFNPTAGLTRGAAAKIICNMILGPTDAEALGTTDAPYSDVPAGSTFAGYISYCASEGIISGYADGTFKPAAPLTGYAFMKMLLGALGYDAAVEGYTGTNWSVQVAKRALNIGLDDGLNGTFNGSKALTREEACLYAFNALQATMVEYDNNTSISVGDITITTSTKAEECNAISSRNYNGAAINTDDYDTLQFCEKYFEDLTIVTGKNKDDFGRPATTWKYDKDEVGTYVSEEPILVYTEGFDADELDDLLDEYDFTNTTVKVNGQTNCNGLNTIANLADREYTGTVIELYDADEDDDIELAVVIQGYLAQVTDEDEEDITVEIHNPWGTKDTVIYDDNTKKDDDTFDKLSAAYDEDDYFMIFTKAADTAGAVIGHNAVEVVTGEVSTYKLDSVFDGYVMVDGEKLTMASGYNEQTIKAGDEYNFFLDENGYVIGAEPVKENAAEIEDVYFVDEIWSKTSTVAGNTGVVTHYAELVSLDGTVTEVVLEKVDKNDGTDSYVTNEATYEKQLVTISDKKWTDDATKTHKAGDEKFDLKLWDEYGTDDYDWDLYTAETLANLKKTSTRVAGNAGTYRLNDNTKYIFIEGTQNDIDVDVYTGGVAYTWQSRDVATVITEHDTMVAAYVIIATADSTQGQTYSDDAIFVKSSSSEKGDGYRVQTVYTAEGEKITLNVDETEYPITTGFYTYDTNDDGYIVLDAATAMIVPADKIWDENEGTVKGTLAKDALYNDLLTIKGVVEDIDVADTVFVDAHDTDEYDDTNTPTGNYNKTVGSLEQLCDLIDNDKVKNVTVYVNANDDGAVIVVVTSIKKI